jgi:hypothetical protein
MLPPLNSPISFGQIRAQFGGNTQTSISSYYNISGSPTSGITGIPSSGSISFSHFAGKDDSSPLNSVVTKWYGDMYWYGGQFAGNSALMGFAASSSWSSVSRLDIVNRISDYTYPPNPYYPDDVIKIRAGYTLTVQGKVQSSGRHFDRRVRCRLFWNKGRGSGWVQIGNEVILIHSKNEASYVKKIASINYTLPQPTYADSYAVCILHDDLDFYDITAFYFSLHVY